MGTKNSEAAKSANELQTLRRQLTALQEQVLATKAMRVRQEQTEHALRERVKELNCLYRITEAVDRFGDSQDELLQEITDGLPGSWQYPEITSARIVYGEREYATAGFRPSLWLQATEFVVFEKKAGIVEVYYLKEMPDLDEGPFLKEERLLIDAVAERTGKIIERISAKQQLQVERTALKQSNIAMHELMARIQEEKAQIGKAVQSNVERIIMPILEAIESGALPQQKGYLNILRQNLEEIVSPFVDKLANEFMSLTPAEIRICEMIRRGLSTKEIAQLQSIAAATVRHHREHIRRKLGLTSRNINLTTYLNRLMSSQSKSDSFTSSALA